MFFPSDYRSRYSKNVKNNTYCVHTKVSFLKKNGKLLGLVEGRSVNWDIIPRTINLSREIKSKKYAFCFKTDIDIYVIHYNCDCDGTIQHYDCTNMGYFDELKNKYGGDYNI